MSRVLLAAFRNGGDLLYWVLVLFSAEGREILLSDLSSVIGLCLIMLGMGVLFGSHHSAGSSQYFILRSTLMLVMVEQRL